MLSVKHIDTGYGKKQVLFEVNVEIEKGQSVLLIGSNGSGKSTLFKAIYGTLPLWKGEVYFEGNMLHSAEKATHPPKLIQQGLMYLPQKKEVFEEMNVEQNLAIATLHLQSKKETKARLDKVYEELGILKDKKNQTASKLSGGERKLLSLGMVLMNQPKLLLYDEPLAGLSGNNVKIVIDWLKKIKESSVTLIIIEHRIKEIISLADRVFGLKLGKRNNESLNSLETIKSFLI